MGPGTTSVGSLTLAGTLGFDSDGLGLRFQIIGDSVIESTGTLFLDGSIDCTTVPGTCVPYTNTLALSGDLQIDGELPTGNRIVASGPVVIARSVPVIELNDGASLSGNGLALLAARVVKNDPGTVTFGPDLDVVLSYEPAYEVRGILEVNAGTLDIQSAEPNGSFVGDGTIAIGPGATVNLPSGTALGADSVVDIGIDGSSSNPDNYGRLLLPDGSSAGTLSTTFTSIPEYTPNIFDRYSVVDCAAACSPFPTATLGGSLAQLTHAGDLQLGFDPTVPTFINDTFGASWNDPANWSTGTVPTSGAALVPAGAFLPSVFRYCGCAQPNRRRGSDSSSTTC